MILVNLFQMTYVVDFFYNEDWYLRTIDIAHDHFGWYLIYGTHCVVPIIYNINTHFLLRNPIDLSNFEFFIVLLLACVGYGIFRGCNYQKDIVRRTQGKCKIWGKQAKVIRAEYGSSDG